MNKILSLFLGRLSHFCRFLVCHTASLGEAQKSPVSTPSVKHIVSCQQTKPSRNSDKAELQSKQSWTRVQTALDWSTDGSGLEYGKSTGNFLLHHCVILSTAKDLAESPGKSYAESFTAFRITENF